MPTVGLRELRQNASDIIRDVESGQVTTVTVSGRPVAQIVPIKPKQWVPWEQARRAFTLPVDPEWDAERRSLGTLDIEDPWERHDADAT